MSQCEKNNYLQGFFFNKAGLKLAMSGIEILDFETRSIFQTEKDLLRLLR